LQRIASHSRANNAALDLEPRLFGLREVNATRLPPQAQKS